jgi:hypothetical protein
MEQKNVLRVVVASPSDVQAERDSLKDVFEALNHGMADERGYRLDLYRWETDAHPGFHALGPSGVVDSSLRIEDCDIIIGLFWKRFGTPTPDAGSGTEHELRLAYETWKQTAQRPLIMIYFSKTEFFPRTIEEVDQLKKVLEFRKGFAPEALYGDYDGPEDFRRKVQKDLTQVIRKLEPKAAQLAQAAQSPPSEPPSVENPGNAAELAKLQSVPLHTFGGLRRAVRHENLFQDFVIDRRDFTNPSPISYLWADVYRGGSVNANIEETQPPVLGVKFENKPSSWPSNVSIRPTGQQAVTTRGARALAFDARVAPAEQSDSGALSEVFIAVRVVNGWFQHWAYGPGAGSYRLLSIRDQWATIEILLNAEGWWLFGSDGNYCFGPQRRDFAVIASLVIEFGSEGLERPGPGRGTVQIRNVRLQD